MHFSVTKNGRPLNPSLYTWNEETRTFSTNENVLVLDFSNLNEITFKTGFTCIFKTGSFCTFDTGSNCTFKTASHCTFKTGPNCTFNTGSDCTFKTGKECVVIRRDIFEIIKLEQESNHIKLNGNNIPGYEEILDEHIIMIDGKEIKISNESYEELKKQLK